MKIEHGTFIQVVFLISAVLITDCSVFHKHRAQTFTCKFEEHYQEDANPYKLSFIILRSALQCIRWSYNCSGKIDNKVFCRFCM